MAEAVTEVTEEIGFVGGFLQLWYVNPTRRPLEING
jgi:hypothetical protein